MKKDLVLLYQEVIVLRACGLGFLAQVIFLDLKRQIAHQVNLIYISWSLIFLTGEISRLVAQMIMVNTIKEHL